MTMKMNLMNRKMVLILVPIGIGIALIVFCFLLPMYGYRDSKLPKGYSKAVAGGFISYNDVRMTRKQILVLREKYPEMEYFVRTRKGFDKFSEDESSEFSAAFSIEKNYWCTVVQKDAVVKGFVFQEE